MARLKASQFLFRRNDNIGAEGAEHDRAYLEDCFYDRGDLEILRDCESPKAIIVGRTGTGKTALLLKLEDEEEHAVRIEPEDLSLQYLSNSTILPQLEQLGVNLGLFYKLLWRHIFAVELIKSKYNLKTEESNRTFLERIWDYFSRDKQKEKTIEYLRAWGEEFWKDTEYRVRDVTTKLETDVKAKIGAKYAGLVESAAESGEKYSVEEKADVVRRIQEVVNAIQIRQLNQVIKMLGESEFASVQPRFYLVIDKLDEDWVDSKFRYRLIKALIETIKEFNNQIRGVKILVAIRRDLLDVVIHDTREPGFQEEKYGPLYLGLKWNENQLAVMLNRRIDKLVSRRFSGEPVQWSDILPRTVNRSQTINYMIERTLYRPRDLIVFFNLCIEQATDKPEITAQMIVNAEAQYSLGRLRSLYDEWNIEFPELESIIPMFKKTMATFPIGDLSDESVLETCLGLATQDTKPHGEVSAWAKRVIDDDITCDEFRARLLSICYRVGLVGLRIDKGTAVVWSYLHNPSISWVLVNDHTIIHISPIFWRALGTQPSR